VLTVKVGFIEPGMPLYLFYGGPFGAIVAEQSQNEFLELGRQSRAIHFVEVELVLP
jgi:hypothetical protein